MLSHYSDARDVSSGELEAIYTDWFNDLDDVPLDVLRWACETWRKERDYPPSIAGIRKIAAPILEARRVVVRRLSDFLQVRPEGE